MPDDEVPPGMQAKAVLIGSMGVGKTALSNRFISRSFDPNYRTTVAIGYSTHRFSLAGHRVELHLWDTAGMERYAALGPIYYRGADAAIFVYDVTDPDSARDLALWDTQFRAAIENPFFGMVVANKVDLGAGADTAEIERWARGLRFGFTRTSAKTGDGVDELFDTVVQGAFLLKNKGVFQRAGARGAPQPAPCC